MAEVDKLNLAPNTATQVVVGQRVVAEINCVPECSGCRNYHERAQHPGRTALGIFGSDGAFAEFVAVPIENIHMVPEALTDDQAMFAEPLAAACQISQQIHIQSSDRCAVVGTGKLGVLIAQVLSNMGGVVTAAGRREANFAFLQAQGITTALVSDLLDQKLLFDVVVDCTGNEEGFATALALTRPTGTLVLKSTFAGKTSADLTQVVVNEIKLVGSRYVVPFPLHLFPC